MPDADQGAANQTEIDNLLDRYSGCLQTGGDLKGELEDLRDEWSSQKTSADAILERAGAKRMSPEEFGKHFGHLPTDGEG